jgi:hypothetical protein
VKWSGWRWKGDRIGSGWGGTFALGTWGMINILGLYNQFISIWSIPAQWGCWDCVHRNGNLSPTFFAFLERQNNSSAVKVVCEG